MSEKERVRAFMQAKFGHTDGAQPLAGAGTMGRNGGKGGGTTFVGAGSANVHEQNIDPVLSDVFPPGAGAGSMRSGGTGGQTLSIGAGSNRVGSREPMQKAENNLTDSNARTDEAGGGSRRSGGTGNPGGPDPGGFKGGKSSLAGRGGHMLSKTMDDLGQRGDTLDKSASTKPVDVADVGENWKHVGHGVDYAREETRASGSVHPMDHAGKMGKGRW